MEETYRKVFIKTEADLPKKDGGYLVCWKTDEYEVFVFTYRMNKDYWLKNIDWYLQPVTAKTDQEWTNDKVIDFVNWHLKVCKVPERFELENQSIIDSFLRRDVPELWHKKYFGEQETKCNTCKWLKTGYGHCVWCIHNSAQRLGDKSCKDNYEPQITEKFPDTSENAKQYNKETIGSTTDFVIEQEIPSEDAMNQKAIKYGKLKSQHRFGLTDSQRSEAEIDFLRGYNAAVNELIKNK